MAAFVTALVLAVGIAMDGAIVVASRVVAGRDSRRLPWLFGASHAAMATLGWALGRQAGAWLQQWDHWVASAILVVVGGRMLAAPTAVEKVVERRWEVPALCLATSIDASAAGVTLDALGIHPALGIGAITVVCVAMSLAALALAGFVGARAGRHLGRLGGLMLIAIAVRVVVQHAA